MTPTTTTNGFPLTLALPGGVTAQHVPGSDPPRYAVEGKMTFIDVRIPDDLSGWHWNGSLLCQQGERGMIWIASDTFGVPGVFEQARTIERVRAEREAERAMPKTAQKKKPKKLKIPERAPVSAAPAQLALFEEVA